MLMKNAVAWAAAALTAVVLAAGCTQSPAGPYATAGDAYDSDNAQNRASLAGKILRMTPTGGVPSDNPFPRSLVYSVGHRNPQGIAWAEDGTMYATEFGQDTWDELNVIKPGGNYGWPVVEGIGQDDRYIDPVQQWRPDDDRILTIPHP